MGFGEFCLYSKGLYCVFDFLLDEFRGKILFYVIVVEGSFVIVVLLYFFVIILCFIKKK